MQGYLSLNLQNPYKKLDLITCVSANPALAVRVGGWRWVESGAWMGLTYSYRLQKGDAVSLNV